jgi:hypothetical protein
MWGLVDFDHAENSSTIDCPAVYDQRTGVSVNIGCAAQQVYNGNDNFDSRHQLRVDGEWNIGSHDVTFGYQQSKFFGNVTSHYSGPVPPAQNLDGVGGYTWIYLTAPTSGDNACHTGEGNFLVPGCGDYVRRRVFVDNLHYKSMQKNFYLQDNWNIGNFYFRYGARSSSFENDNPLGKAFVDINNQIAPRLGLSWDVFGDSTLKLYANAGRYYIPISGDANTRLAGAELDYYQFYTFTGMNPDDGTPTGTKQFGTSDDDLLYENGATGTIPDAATVTAKNLKPMHQDEFILGAQYRFPGTQWSLGLRGIHRKLKDAVDDVCTFIFPDADAVEYIADKLGTTPDAVASVSPGCFFLNPGDDTDVPITLPDGTSHVVSVPAEKIGVPKATRKYNAVELLFDRSFDGTWFLHGSLTWSHVYGNEEGYLLSDIGQVDAGLTEAFDFPDLMKGAYGDLPSDRRWVLKIYGAYNFTSQWQMSFNFNYTSGGPLSCFGFDNDVGQGYAYLYGNDSHYCHIGGKDTLVPRGSVGRGPRVYNLDAGIHYMPDWAPGLRFGISVQNLFNFQHPTLLNQTHEDDGGKPNTSYLSPYDYQDPREFRFSIEYDFL